MRDMEIGKKIIVLDGAMGSLLLKKGFHGCLEELNITNPEEIKRIHCAYSSADIILTNTFGLNSLNYKGEYFLKEIALKAVENARAARKPVFFDMGPVRKTPYMGGLTFAQEYAAFKEIVDIAKDVADGFFVETFSDLSEAETCIRAIKENSSKPVFATMTFCSDQRTFSGATPETVASALESYGADALGANCSPGAEKMAQIVKRMADCTALPIIAKPNLGLPSIRNGKAFYSMGVDLFEECIVKIIEAGASVIGGCCGTTPEYIKRISEYSGFPVNRRTKSS